MYASMNFLRKSEFEQAVIDGAPIVLYSPTLATPAVNGLEEVEGPWPGTIIPVKSAPRCVCRAKSWRARVRLQDMRVVEVM